MAVSGSTLTLTLGAATDPYVGTHPNPAEEARRRERVSGKAVGTDVVKLSLGDSLLAYTPPRGQSGQGFATFAFRVAAAASDGLEAQVVGNPPERPVSPESQIIFTGTSTTTPARSPTT